MLATGGLLDVFGCLKASCTPFLWGSPQWSRSARTLRRRRFNPRIDPWHSALPHRSMRTWRPIVLLVSAGLVNWVVLLGNIAHIWEAHIHIWKLITFCAILSLAPVRKSGQKPVVLTWKPRRSWTWSNVPTKQVTRADATALGVVQKHGFWGKKWRFQHSVFAKGFLNMLMGRSCCQRGQGGLWSRGGNGLVTENWLERRPVIFWQARQHGANGPSRTLGHPAAGQHRGALRNLLGALTAWVTRGSGILTRCAKMNARSWWIWWINQAIKSSTACRRAKHFT